MEGEIIVLVILTLLIYALQIYWNAQRLCKIEKYLKEKDKDFLGYFEEKDDLKKRIEKNDES